MPSARAVLLTVPPSVIRSSPGSVRYLAKVSAPSAGFPDRIVIAPGMLGLLAAIVLATQYCSATIREDETMVTESGSRQYRRRSPRPKHLGESAELHSRHSKCSKRRSLA